jgi:hypothetical protein
VVEQADLLIYAVETLERLGHDYAIVGAFASGIWGEPRFTQDIDILLKISPGDIKLLCHSFPPTEFYVSEPVAEDAARHHTQFNVIHPTSGNKLDFMIAGTSEWTSAQLSRRRRVNVLGEKGAFVAAPEDVILGKLVYYREGGSEKHLRDITTILQISDDLVDRNYINEFAAKLGVVDIWQAILNRMES